MPKHELIRRISSESMESLKTDVLPFWLRHGIDRERGGIWTALDRTGRLMDEDKSGWFQGRATWTFSRAVTDIPGSDEEREQWFDAATATYTFLHNRCRRGDGRYYFRVTRDGDPLIVRRYPFTEAFAALGSAAYSRAAMVMGRANEADTALRHAEAALGTVERLLSTPSLLPPKLDPETRPSEGFAIPMILLNVRQELIRVLEAGAEVTRAEEVTRAVDEHIADMKRFLDPERRCVREQLDPDGAVQDHLEGRLLNPGHAIEGAWFLMAEAQRRGGDERVLELGRTMLDWMWEWGWDRDYGGILYFRDSAGFESSEYWHDMKFWWPQCEAIVANALALVATGREDYAERLDKVYRWTMEHFPDPQYGEWYGYLHRDGTPSNRLKGTLFKGPFHIPRMMIQLASIA